jgi:uncharacterized membrane protein
MADTRQRTTWGTRLRFLSRSIGLTGILAAVIGVTLAATAFPSIEQWNTDTFRTATDGTLGRFARVAAISLAVGVVAIALALAVELLGALVLITGRRTAASTTATIGTIAALALLIFVNAYSFTHHARYDFTRNRQFTLATDLAERLRTLRSDSPTTIVVLQKHKVFGTLSDDRDAFTKAAEEKVTEKIKDLVDLFREFGPRFNVVVLDTEAFGYRKQLEDLTRDAPELRDAIKSAPENSILFHANKRVQRLAFNEFLQLDKTASEAANGGRANLVLLPQGIENFARRVLSVQERRPKVAVCVVHELLSTEFAEGRGRTYTMAGLRKSLTENGYDVIDVVLKKNWSSAGSLEELKPAADTRAESTLERLEGELTTAEAELASAREEARLFEEILKRIADVKGRPWNDRNALYQKLVRGAEITEEVEPQFLASITRRAERANQALDEANRERRTAEDRVTAAMKDERSLQDRRASDVKEKLTRVLADVDLLVIPRFTVEDATEGLDVAPAIHKLSKEQVEVIRDFMAKGKPVLACLGPITPSLPRRPGESAEDFEKRMRTAIAEGTDGFENLIAERGIELGPDLVLFDGESRAFAARRAGKQFGGGVPTDIPPLVLSSSSEGLHVEPNPVAAATRLTARSVDQKLDVRLRALRPVYIAPRWQARLPFAAEFAFTSPESWNELRPYLQFRPLPDGTVTATDVPRYDPTDKDDPKKGTREEERRGPFPVGVAIENKIPATWINEEYGREEAAATVLLPVDGLMAAGLTVSARQLDRPQQRLIVFGSGNLFAGAKLEPPQEKLLLHSVNWLTGREDRLPRAEEPAWSFPRVAMTDREQILWRLGTAIGLPLVAIYMGLMVMMVRRLR